MATKSTPPRAIEPEALNFIDAAYTVGLADSQSTAENAKALRGALKMFSGKEDAHSIASWKVARDSFVKGAVTGGATPNAAVVRWARIVDVAKLVKPQSAAQRAKAEAKRVERATSPQTGAGVGKVTPSSAAGLHPAIEPATSTAKGVRMELGSMEAHVIGLMRSGKYAQAAQCIADMAAQDAPV
jgi:hypothetical protein